MGDVDGAEAVGMDEEERGTSSSQRGQVLVIVIFAIFGLLAVVGLGVDLGLYYIERIRVTRAVDAAALAAAAELPLESAAHLRAQEFLLENGYDPFDPDTCVTINGTHQSGPAEESAWTVVELDTESFRDADLPPAEQLNSSYRIQVRLTRRVPVIFLQFVGFDSLPAYASATAENINNLDIVIVFDKSGSMEFDTLCYGCWEPVGGIPYPGGQLHPLPWRGPANALPEHCGPLQWYAYGSHRYYFIEAEEYSRLGPPYYYRSSYSQGVSYWVLGRNNRNGSNYVRASGRDNRGAYIIHYPYPDFEHKDGYGVTCMADEVSNGGWCNSDAPGGPYPAPRADYEFVPPQSRTYYVWVRGQAMRTDWDWERPDGLDSCLHWGVNGAYQGTECGFRDGVGYNGASARGSDRWEWRRVGSFFGTEGDSYTLNLWAGGCGFAVDLIALTTTSSGYDGHPPDPLERSHWGWWQNGREWANGRTEWACSACDARFAGYPDRADELGSPSDWVQVSPICSSGPNPDRRFDDIYDDEQPIRAAVEAAKGFVAMLDPRYDQIGYVRYDNNVGSGDVVGLQCLRELGRDQCTPQVITETVMARLDSTEAGGGTNIAEGMLEGIDVLSTIGGHNGRPGAAHVMILMTDGQANAYPNSQCYQEDLWPDQPGESTSQRRGRDCVMYYAREARDNSIVIYTITLGGNADFELMQAVADMTGGVHRNADRPEKLPAIFDELYERIFLRLVE